MAVMQFGIVGQDAETADVVVQIGASAGFAVRLIIEDTTAVSSAEVLRGMYVVEKGITQDTFPSAFEVASRVQYAPLLGGGYETMIIGGAGGVGTAYRFIVDRGVSDPVTTKAQTVVLTWAIAECLAKYPFT